MGRTTQLVIASLLTILIGTVTVYRGMAIWTATPAEIWERGFWVLFAALSTTSLVNVWAQVVQGSGVSVPSVRVGPGLTAFTRTPLSPYSAAQALVSRLMAALLEP
jgi:hypothetical protein